MFHLSNCLPPIHWARTRTKEGPLGKQKPDHITLVTVSPLSLDENELLSPSPARSVTCHLPDLSVHHPSGHFLGSLNLARLLFHLLKCLLLSLTQMLLPQILTPRVLVPSHSITIADHPHRKPPPHAHIFNCYHSCNFYFRDCVHEAVIMLIESLVTKPVLGSIGSQ